VGWSFLDVERLRSLYSAASIRDSGDIAGWIRVVIRAQDVASLRNVAVMQQRLTDDTVPPSGSTHRWLRDYAGGPAAAGAP
jgi:hypothetical protein